MTRDDCDDAWFRTSESSLDTVYHRQLEKSSIAWDTTKAFLNFTTWAALGLCTIQSKTTPNHLEFMPWEMRNFCCLYSTAHSFITAGIRRFASSLGSEVASEVAFLLSLCPFFCTVCSFNSAGPTLMIPRCRRCHRKEFGYLPVTIAADLGGLPPMSLSTAI